MIREVMKKPIWVYRKPIDFRKQINGLVQTVVDEMKRSPGDGAVYVFRNQQRDKIKVLMWDRNGFVLGYKRLERGKFDFSIESDEVRLSWVEFWDLISGMPLVRLKSGTVSYS